VIVREIRLENVKSFGSPAEVVRLYRGVNAICGQNGAGKSTVLEAIGCALFDHLPYRHEDFVREGAPHGMITVVVDSRFDQRTYEVVRRIARTNAAYFVHDPEIRQHVAQGTADVKRWLHQHLQIPDEVDLASLFLDAVGPPQGTLTAAFLEAPGPRKAKFSRLLRVQEYEDAWQKLRELDKAIDDEKHDLDVKIADLAARAEDRPNVELDRAAKRDEQLDLARQLSRLEAERESVDRMIQTLDAAERAWQRAERAAQDAGAKEERAADRHERVQADWQAASDAVQTCSETQDAREEYQRAESRLADLVGVQRERDRLATKRSEVEKRVELGKQKIEQMDEDVVRLEGAEAEVAALEAKIPEQEEAERRLQVAREAKREADDLRQGLRGKQERLLRDEARVAQARGEVAQVLKLQPVADELAARQAAHAELAERLAGANQAHGEIQAVRTALGAEQRRGAGLRERVQQLDRAIAAGTTAPATAPVAVLEERFNAANSQRAAAVSHLDHARQTRSQVAGGLCPFLNEACRNLRPGVTLDAHFDGEVKRWTAEVANLRPGVASAEAELTAARQAEERLRRVEEWRGQRETFAADLAESDARVEEHQQKLREAAALATRRTEIRDQEQMALRALREAEQAVRDLGRLSALNRTLEDAQRDHEALAEEIRRDRARLAGLKDADAELAAAEAARKAIGTPREKAAILRAEVQELPKLRALRQRSVERLAQLQSELAELDAQCAPFASLDAEIDDLHARREACNPAYLRHVAAEPVAATLDDRTAALRRAAAELEAAAAEARIAHERLDEAARSYDQAEHERASQRRERLAGEIGEARRSMQHAREEEERLEVKLRELEAVEAELAEARAQVERLEEERDIANALRKAIREAGPEITGQILARISRTASRINGEILNQSGIEIEWTKEFDVITKRQGEIRGFAQLSGGEQMAAALAVRLAVLRDLSNVRVAFLDEPTAHLDQERRTNLGDQVQRLQGFDQLVVISHDDTFDGLFGHVVRLARQGDVSRVIDQN
jgi:DNA repair protein SbcC/Rad50